MSRVNLIVWCLLTLCGGVLLKLTLPPIGFGLLIFVAWIPALIILVYWNLGYALLTGLVMGAFWFSDLPLALLKWGWQLPFFSWLLGCAMICGLMGLCHSMIRRCASLHSVFIFPSIMTLMIFCGQSITKSPVALSPLLVDDWTSFFSLGKYLGFYGLEFIIALMNSVTAHLIVKFLNRKKCQTLYLGQRHAGLSSKLLIVPSLLLFSCLLIDVSREDSFQTSRYPDRRQEIPIYAIQPGISHDDALRAADSLHHRKKNEETIDTLSKLALGYRKPGLIIWPEGGHNFSNLLIQRRRHKLFDLMQGKESEMLISGYEYLNRSNKTNSVTLISKDGMEKTISKAILAPMAESHLQEGTADIIESRFATLGIAICFEAVFNPHFQALKKKGAELFVVVTDDSSFGNTFLYRRHLAYARVNAAIYRTPLVFVNNYGDSFLIGKNGEVHERDSRGRAPHIMSWKTATSSANDTVYYASHNAVVLCAVSITILLLMSGFPTRSQLKIQTRNEWRRSATFRVFFTTTAVASAVLIDSLALLWHRDIGLVHLFHETRQRYYGQPALDAISPIFQQRSKTSCGAAAIAYALTRMGDSVFEFDVLEAHPASGKNGYSLGEIAAFAQSRGFSTAAYRASVDDLPKQGQTPVIAHLQEDHYVVVLHANKVEAVFFDPAHGQIFHQPRQKFDERWTNVLLQIHYDETWFIADGIPRRKALRLVARN